MTQRATTPYFQGQASVLKYGMYDLKFSL